MSNWTPKRFWKTAAAVATDGGFTVQLDGRAVKTPAKSLLVVPTMALAQAIALEWDAQVDQVRPETMPLTRTANSAIDKVTPQKTEVAALIAAYGGSDQLCYRAEGPAELFERQAVAWDPLLDWAADHLGARLNVGPGVMHVAQNPIAVETLAARVHALDSFSLAAFHDLVAISGSLILGFAVTEGRLTADDAWFASRIDEDWQIELWGRDDEAEALANSKRLAFQQAARFHKLVQN